LLAKNQSEQANQLTFKSAGMKWRPIRSDLIGTELISSAESKYFQRYWKISLEQSEIQCRIEKFPVISKFGHLFH
jgi:hypothetical protein